MVTQSYHIVPYTPAFVFEEKIKIFLQKQADTGHRGQKLLFSLSISLKIVPFTICLDAGEHNDYEFHISV